MSETIVSLRDVWVQYRQRPVLEGVSLEVRRGEFLTIVGPNGAGKTTLIKVILGLVRPSRGEVLVFGKPPWTLGPERSRIGYVPQLENTDPNFPVKALDVVLMGRYGKLGLVRRPGKEDLEAALAAMERVGVRELAHEPLGHLSGGQRQRVFLARALATDPELLLLDEPTTGVDVQASESFYELLRRLQRQGVTIVMVSHDIGVVSRYVDKVACLNRRVVVHGKPEEVSASEALAEMYGCAALFFHHGKAPHMVVRLHELEGKN
ncbi:MAG TPA: metal ABC transporter ATP-binding protein [Candidatus Acetothermia bacterium]|nr:metal ABC transporter ATP-binding protein [Candidatus Acetothermia bacterium]